MLQKNKVPESWEEVELFKYLELISSGVKRFPGQKKYIDTGALETGRIKDFVEVTYDDRPSRANMEVKEGDVLFAKMKDTEKIYLVSKEDSNYLYSTGFAVLRIKEPPKLIPKYLYFWLRTENFQSLKNKESSGATQKAIGETKLRNFKIVIPPIQEQKNIVSILEKAEKAKELRKEADSLTDEFLKAIFYEMFGDPIKNEKGYKVKTLNDICLKITDGSHYTPTILTDGYPFMTVANMREHGFNYENCKRISQDDFVKLVKNDCKPLKGDVLFSKDGTVGKVLEVKEDIEAVVLSSIAILRPDTAKVLPTFLAEFLKTDFALNQAIERKSGSAIRRIILQDIKKIKIPLLSIELQNRFSTLVKDVEEMKDKQKKSKEHINDLFNVLMQNAFRGELI